MKKAISVIIKNTVRAYNGFFKMDKVVFDQERFDGSVMKDVTREVFIRKPIVFLALYDPKLDKHLFVEQVRVGAIVNTPESPLVLEPVAGIIDDGENPIEAAIREAQEEAGVDADLDTLAVVQEGYTSPGGSSEYAYFVTGEFDSSNYKEQIGGVDGENEDVRSHLIDSDTAMDMIANGQINSLSGAFGVYWHKSHN